MQRGGESGRRFVPRISLVLATVRRPGAGPDALPSFRRSGQRRTLRGHRQLAQDLRIRDDTRELQCREVRRHDRGACCGVLEPGEQGPRAFGRQPADGRLAECAEGHGRACERSDRRVDGLHDGCREQTRPRECRDPTPRRPPALPCVRGARGPRPLHEPEACAREPIGRHTKRRSRLIAYQGDRVLDTRRGVPANTLAAAAKMLLRPSPRTFEGLLP